MADCNKYDSMISALMDGELSDDEMVDLREHAHSCEICYDLIKLYPAMSHTIYDSEESPPDKLHLDIMAQIRHENKRSKSRRLLRRLTTVAAVLVVVISGLFLVRQSLSHSDNSNSTAEVQASAVTEFEPDDIIVEHSAASSESQAIDETPALPTDNSPSPKGYGASDTETPPSEATVGMGTTYYGILADEGSTIEVFFTDTNGSEMGMPVSTVLIEELITCFSISNETVTTDPLYKIRFFLDGEEQIYSIWTSGESILVKGSDDVLYVPTISLENFESLFPSTLP